MTYVVDRAYNDYGWYYTLTQQGSKFVGRMKSNAVHEVVDTLVAKGDGIILFSSAQAKKDCPTWMRGVKFRRKEDGKILIFVT